MYEIPKIATPVVINLVNDETISGFIWLTENFISSTREARIEALLNQDEDRFFSFQSDAGAFRLINKQHVTFIETETDDTEIISRSTISPTTMVAHFVNEQTLFGMIYPSLPEESRVSDFLNLKSDFLVVYRQQKKIILNRNLIVYANAN
jgi:hypothetical protein|tara:strand:- start:5843 stop:6292 length:450 start_codon:yes stop_codon:yes gene_type:complete